MRRALSNILSRIHLVSNPKQAHFLRPTVPAAVHELLEQCADPLQCKCRSKWTVVGEANMDGSPGPVMFQMDSDYMTVLQNALAAARFFTTGERGTIVATADANQNKNKRI